jgi:hypothetical protein
MKARCTKCSTIFEATPDDEGVLFCASCGHRMRVKKPVAAPAEDEAKVTAEVPAPAPGKAGGGSTLPAVMKANKVVAGRDCPGCKEKIDLGVEVHNCESCGASHHAKCWADFGRCQSADCPGRLAPKKSSEPAEGADDTQPCKFCGEAIRKGARKCRHCGEYQNERDRAAAEKAKLSVDDETVPWWIYLLAFLLPLAACIVGIVWASQGKPKGSKTIGVAFLMAFLCGAVRVAIMSSRLR